MLLLISKREDAFHFVSFTCCFSKLETSLIFSSFNQQDFEETKNVDMHDVIMT